MDATHRLDVSPGMVLQGHWRITTIPLTTFCIFTMSSVVTMESTGAKTQQLVPILLLPTWKLEGHQPFRARFQYNISVCTKQH